MKRFVLYFNMKSRDDLAEGEEKVETNLTFLARDKNVAINGTGEGCHSLNLIGISDI